MLHTQSLPRRGSAMSAVRSAAELPSLSTHRDQSLHADILQAHPMPCRPLLAGIGCPAHADVDAMAPLPRPFRAPVDLAQALAIQPEIQYAMRGVLPAAARAKKWLRDARMCVVSWCD